jgi:uncharacterized membrane protein YqjE
LLGQLPEFNLRNFIWSIPAKRILAFSASVNDYEQFAGRIEGLSAALNMRQQKLLQAQSLVIGLLAVALGVFGIRGFPSSYAFPFWDVVRLMIVVFVSLTIVLLALMRSSLFPKGK